MTAQETLMASFAHDPVGPPPHDPKGDLPKGDLPKGDLPKGEVAACYENAERGPGLVMVTGAVVAFVVAVATFALGQVGVGITVASAALLVFGAGLSWLGMERRRVRDVERELLFNADLFSADPRRAA
jgi:hypothetical protein